MQYVFFEKGTRNKAPEVTEKNGGAGCTSCSPNNFVGGAVAPPVPAAMTTLGLSCKHVYYH